MANSLDDISRAVSEPPAGHAASARASVVSSAVSDSPPAGHAASASASAVQIAVSEPPAGHAVAGSEPVFSLVNLNVDRFVRELESSYHGMSLENLEIAAEHAKSVLSYSQGRGGGYNLRGEPVGGKANSQRPSHVEPELWDPLTPGQKKDKLGLVKLLQSRLEKLIAQLADRAVTMRGLLAVTLFQDLRTALSFLT